MRKTANEMATELEVGDIHTKGEDWGDQLRPPHRPARRRRLHARCSRACPATTCQCPHWGYIARGLDHTCVRRRHRGREPGRRPLLLARRPHRLDRRGRRLRRVQPGRRDPRPCSSTSAPSWPRRPEPAPLGSVAPDAPRADDARRRTATTRWRRRATPSRATTGRPPSTPPRGAALDDRRGGGRPARPAWPRRRGGSAGSTSASTARERAYRAYDELGDHRRAGQCAVWLCEHHAFRARPAIAGGWLRRARRALEDDPECVEYGSPAPPRGRDGPRRRRARPRPSALATEALALGRRAAVDRPRGRGAADHGPGPHRPGRARRGHGPPRRGDALRRRGPAPAVLDRQGVLQPDQRLRGGRRLRPGRRVDRGHAALGRAAPVRHLPRHLPRAPRRRPQAARLAGRGRARGGPGLRGAARQSHVANSAAALRRGRRHPPPPRRPRPGRGGLRPVPGAQRRAVRRARAAAPRPGPGRRRHGDHHRLRRRQPTNPLARAGLLPMLVHVAVAAGDLDAADDAARRARRASSTTFDTPMLRATGRSTRGRLQLARARRRRAGATLQERGRARGRRSTCPTRRPPRGRCSARRCATAATRPAPRTSFAAAAALFDQIGARLDAAARATATRSRRSRPGSPSGRSRCSGSSPPA